MKFPQQKPRLTAVTARIGARRARGVDVMWTAADQQRFAVVDRESIGAARKRLRADNHFLFLLLNARPINLPDDSFDLPVIDESDTVQ